MDERMTMLGQRFAEERNRLQLTQRALGTALGRDKKTIINYEAGHTSPRADDLLVMGRLGANVKYIVTGMRGDHAPGLTADEETVLREFRAFDAPTRRVALRLMAALANQDAIH